MLYFWYYAPNNLQNVYKETAMEPIKEYSIGSFHVCEYSELSSTNDFLKAEAESGAKDGTVAVALSQTAGKGRLGRSFFSPEGGLYMSVLFRRQIPICVSHLITPAAAVAAARALEAEGSGKIGIKWVNDLYMNGKKVCGILTETRANREGFLETAIIGIGVNLFGPEGGFPEEIKERAGAVFSTADPKIRERLILRILTQLEDLISGLSERSFAEEYAERSTLIGKEVELISPAGTESALVLGIDSDCRLIVRTAEGERGVFAGEVSVKESKSSAGNDFACAPKV